MHPKSSWTGTGILNGIINWLNSYTVVISALISADWGSIGAGYYAANSAGP